MKVPIAFGVSVLLQRAISSSQLTLDADPGPSRLACPGAGRGGGPVRPVSQTSARFASLIFRVLSKCGSAGLLTRVRPAARAWNQRPRSRLLPASSPGERAVPRDFSLRRSLVRSLIAPLLAEI